MSFRRAAPVVLLAALFSIATAHAQFDKDYKSWYGHFAAGYSAPTGDLKDIADGGYNLSGGATFKPENWPVGVIMDLGYNRLDVKKSALIDSMGMQIASGGDIDIWSLTGGGVWAPTSEGTVGFYLSASLGLYRLEGRLTEPGTGCGWVCDPFNPWWCYPTCGGVTVVTGEQATNDFGANVGLGLSFKVSSMGSQIFIEAKYNWINTDFKETQYVPVVIGYRW